MMIVLPLGITACLFALFLWSKRELLHSLYFWLGGVLAATWGLIVSILEFLACYPGWQGACGTGQLVFNPIGLLIGGPVYMIVRFPVIWLAPSILRDRTLDYIWFASTLVMADFVLGSLILTAFAGIVRRWSMSRRAKIVEKKD